VGGDPTTGQLLLVDNLNTALISNVGNVQGGALANQSQVTTAINTVNSLNTTLGAESGTALTISGGGQVVNASSGTLDGSGNRVFTIASNGFSNNNTGFTVNGAASDYVVFNIDNGTSNESLGGPIALSGGITPDHVLFNYVGTSGNLGASAGGATINGTALAPNMKINLDNMTPNGHLFGGLSGQDFQVVSGFHLNATVPEPASAVLAGIGAAGAIAIGKRRRIV
jgi:PEP-CTERM motif